MIIVRNAREAITGSPKKSIRKIKDFFKKAWSGIQSKSNCLNTSGGLDIIL